MIYNFDRDPPPVEWHIIGPEKDWENTWKEWNVNCVNNNDGSMCVGWKLLAVSSILGSSIV